MFTFDTIPGFLAEFSEMRFFNSQGAVAGRLLSALVNADYAELGWFAQFGCCLHQIITNANSHLHQVKFGFTGISFDEYGWLSKPVWKLKETVGFRCPFLDNRKWHAKLRV